MSKNNPVSQVLVTKGNQAPIAAGNKVTDLAPGQVGVFDFETKLSIDNTASPRNFYLAVGLDLDGDTVTDEVAKSRGTHIQVRNVTDYTFRPHTPGRPLIAVLKNYTAECDTEYAIKLELRNKQIYQTIGYNQFTKTYSMKTACCSGCEPNCPSGDANEITKELKFNINSDILGLVTADAIARQALTIITHGTSQDYAIGDVVSDADLDAIMVYNAGQADVANYVYTDLQITTVTQKINTFGNVNLKYFYPRETIAIVSKVGDVYSGFNCTGTIEVTQNAVFEEGHGYDIKQLEYFTIGYDESPYRTSELVGVADSRNFNSVVTEKYDQIVLAYEQQSSNAFVDHFNAESTVIAIPGADTTTRNGLTAIIDAIVATPNGFDAKADDAAAANVNPTVIEKTEDKTSATDGIG